MRVFQALDAVPMWLLFLVSILLFLGATEVGFRVGQQRRKMPRREGDAPSGVMVAAMLGLLGFMLAFTFNSAADRFDNRKNLVLDEANAIGTAFLRARLLPEPHSTAIQDFLRTYVKVRLLGAERPEEVSGLQTEEAIRNALAESEQLHREMWTEAESLTRADPHSIATGLLVQSLNDVIDLHGKRLTVGIRYRIPVVIWVALYALSLLSMFGLGFHGGLASPRRSTGTVLVTLAFVAVLTLIVGLDRGRGGFLEVTHDPLFDVRNSMQPER